MFKKIYLFAKLGLVFGNAIVALGGFFLASRGDIDVVLMAAMFFGISCIMASACVINNYLDRGLDILMARTQKRNAVIKSIPLPVAMMWALFLCVLGSVLLGVYANVLTLCIALFGGLVYVVFYGIGKRKSIHGTLIGSIAGAVPPVVGYTSVTNSFDVAAFILFMMLVIWQMPHFYAIAIFRLADYKAAGIPVLPAVKGIAATKTQMIMYIIAYILAVPALTVYGFTGYAYLIVMELLSVAWLVKSLKGFTTTDDTVWARKLFKFSLIVLMTFSVMIGLGSI